ncbi:aminopeptidase N [Melitaea cinxia]|uniref:aminopeptidase N n=1 Tax=Melitaea cinxia TaxID=113334 RepID=UPI001E271859|nr:aminopeptidase N [Melitaea cinxia]
MNVLEYYSKSNDDPVITQGRKPLTIMDGNLQTDFSTKTKRGVYVSKGLAFVIFVIFTLALIATAFIVYNFAACPRADQLANVTKFELTHCEQSKLQVIPLSTESSKSELETTTSHDESTTKDDENAVTDVRLPTNIRPDRYYIKLTPYIFEGNFTFDGEISIIITVKNKTDKITFHGVELTFHRIELYKKEDGKEVKIIRKTEDVPRQFHIITTGENLIAGQQYVLNISYTGILNDNLHGFYRSSYEEKKVKRWIAVTQFQATDARRAFPCWDEPALKAKFTISIARPNNMTSVSNMNIVGKEAHKTLKDYTWDHYAESLPMSTYLVAFAVTDFGNMSDNNFSVWARKEALPSAAYALEIGPKILKFLEEYYKIKFPLPKIDMIALPDFKAGAMENWGLLTFREIAMLYDYGVSPTTAKARVAAVVAHEIAHQWFGNLVTPAWWSDIWLNEGFASYVEYVAVDAVEKSWKLMEIFILNEVQSVFKLDALTSSHQISVEVGNPEEIGAIFDKISYGKGSAILRMMNHFLTDDVFNAGITDYLNAKKYGDAEQRDLWSALTNAARERNAFDADVAVVMDSWTLQTGFPVLTITRNYEKGSITFRQERFVLINDTLQEHNSSVWWIPVSYTTASEKDFKSTRPKLWLRGERSIVVNDISIGENDWFIANIQQTGFYRINYDQRNWQLLIKVLRHPSHFEQIHPINRAQIIDDAMNLALSGRLDYKTALDISSYLYHERSYVPWKAGLVALGYIDTMLSKGAYYLEYKRYVLTILSGAVEDLGWNVSKNESVVRAQQRADLLSTACHLQQVGCIEHAVRLYTNWMLTPNPDAYNEIHADIRSTVYCVGVQAGGAREWNFAWNRFLVASAPSERELLLSVLGCTREPYLLYRYLDLSLRNDSGIRKQDTVRVFSAVASSSIGEPIAFNFVRSNWQRLKEYVGSVSTLNSILKAVTRRLNQVHEYEELKRFISASCSDLGRPVQQILERTAANVQWMERNYQTIVDWLLEMDKSSPKVKIA